MKIKNYLLATTLTFALFNPATLLAQKKVFPGYYINQQGDTVRGVFTRYSQWRKNPAQVEFTAHQSTNAVRLTPQNALKVVVAGYDEYLSYSGPRLVNSIENDAILNQNFSGVNTDSSEQVVTFLRLVRSTMGGDLYVLNDAKRINFFFQLPAQPIVELKYKVISEQSQIKEVADYKQQLNFTFAEVIARKGLYSSLEKLRYTEEDLSLFFRDMFPGAKANNKQRSASSTWVVAAGVTMNNVSVKADKDFNDMPTTYSPSFSPALTIGCILPLNRSFGKYFVNPQLRLFRYKNVKEEKHGNYIRLNGYQADLAFSATIGGGINFVNQENLQCFLRGGIGALVQVNGKEVKRYYEWANPSSYVNSEGVDLRKILVSTEASAGVVLKKKMFFSATYVPPVGLGTFVFYVPKLSGMQVSVGYKL